jgi:hypothetical protein
MRYNLYIKIESEPELIPFDIFDTSKADSTPISCYSILEEILTFLKLQSDSNLSFESSHKMYKNGREIDLNSSLSDNGIRNGDIITISEQNYGNPAVQTANQFKKVYPPDLENSDEENISSTETATKKSAPLPPGTKIDFD